MRRWCHRTTVFGSPSVMKSPWDSNDGHGQEQVTGASREGLIVQSKFIARTEGAIYGCTRAPRETSKSRTDEIFQFRVYYKTIEQGLPFWHVFHWLCHTGSPETGFLSPRNSWFCRSVLSEASTSSSIPIRSGQSSGPASSTFRIRHSFVRRDPTPETCSVLSVTSIYLACLIDV